MSITHFGIEIKEKKTNYLNKDTYLAVGLSSTAQKRGMWTEELCDIQRRQADLNYDLNMAYFDTLDDDAFDKYVSTQCKKHGFKQCFDLNRLFNKQGIYILVLDKYKQLYIGQSTNIRRRVLNHWNGKKYLDELIWGDTCCSILSIDAFGALDTTRIYISEEQSIYQSENRLVELFDSKYLLNRVSGGIGADETDTGDELSARMACLANMKKRSMAGLLDADRIRQVISVDFRMSFAYYLRKYPELSRPKSMLM
jgi:hypothetical protein